MPRKRLLRQNRGVTARQTIVIALVSGLLLAGLPLSRASAGASAASGRVAADADAASTLDDLLAEEPLLGGEPEFDYRLGLAALRAGRPDVALWALERVVLRQPEHAGAWIDLAVAHRRLGDAQSARTILQHVQATFDPPPGLRGQLEEALRDLQRMSRQDGWQLDAGVQAGYVENANAGLTTSSINLTPGAVQVPVELEPERRARSDAVMQYRAGAYRNFRGPGGSSTEVFAALRSRQFDTESDFDFTDVGAGVLHGRPVFGGISVFAGLSLRHLRLGSSALANFRMVQGGVKAAAGACNFTARLEYEQRDYVANGFAPALIPWVGGGVDCAPGWVEAGISVRTGLDSPQAARAGGDTRRNELTAYARRGLIWGWSGEATLFLAKNQDREGFSGLLENGARRAVERTGYRFTLSRPIGGPQSPWLLQMDYESAQDRSNLELFQLEDQVFLLGFRHAFP